MNVRILLMSFGNLIEVFVSMIFLFSFVWKVMLVTNVVMNLLLLKVIAIAKLLSAAANVSSRFVLEVIQLWWEL